MTLGVDLPAVFARYRPALDAALRAAIPSDGATPDLYDVLRYHLGWLDEHGEPVQRHGGKQLRPTLCFVCCEAAGGDYQRALAAATALELLHNFSLIHDDVEDRGTERRGRPTVWARWGEPLAVNAGDNLLILSELALLRAPNHGIEPAATLEQMRLLNECCLALTEGQHLDLTLEGNPRISRAQYFQVIAGKTAALLGATAQLGALSGGARPEEAEHYRQFGRALGLAFQIQDDVLGIWGEPSTTGKVAAADVYGHKVTLPVIDALQRATPAVARRITAAYQSRAPSGDEVSEVVGQLSALGVRERAEAEVATWIERALIELDHAQPRPGPRADLQALASALVGRKF